MSNEYEKCNEPTLAYIYYMERIMHLPTKNEMKKCPLCNHLFIHNGRWNNCNVCEIKRIGMI
jgi:hypothetical protein